MEEVFVALHVDNHDVSYAVSLCPAPLPVPSPQHAHYSNVIEGKKYCVCDVHIPDWAKGSFGACFIVHAASAHAPLPILSHSFIRAFVNV